LTQYIYFNIAGIIIVLGGTCPFGPFEKIYWKAKTLSFDSLEKKIKISNKKTVHTTKL